MSEITAFYRRYRPQRVEDLDLEQVRTQLSAILKSGKVPHAFLFAGPRGTGKTSSARILAKAINCKDRKGFEPCNKCENCESITKGNNVDVIEIDAASNRGIDEIRDLREKIKLSPTTLPKKVYIIDEVHMLTNEAFNALLKTLEEPPAHAFFVLCTTEPHKILETILSRCQRINFKRATRTEVARSLSRVVEGEKIDIEKEALEEIAKESDGSFRDGVKLLEQLSLSGKKITLADVSVVLGYSQIGNIDKFFDALIAREAKDAINFVNDAFLNGADLKVLTVRIMDYLRGVLMLKNGIDAEGSFKNYDVSIGDLMTLINLFSKASVDYKNALIPQLPLELAIVSWCGDSKKAEEKVEEKVEVEVEKGESKISIDDIKDKWTEILKNVKPHNHSVEAFLKACSPSVWDGKYLTLEVFYKFHKERLEDEKCRSLVEKIISDMMAESVKLKFVLGGGKRSGATPPDDIVKAAAEIFKGEVI